MTGESVVEFSYGRHTDAAGDSYLERLYKIQEMIVQASFGYVVDLAPFRKSNLLHGPLNLTLTSSSVQHLPSWLPGMKFKRDAARWSAHAYETRELMFSQAVKDMVSTPTPCSPSHRICTLRCALQCRRKWGSTASHLTLPMH